MKKITIELTTNDEDFKTYIKAILSELTAHDEINSYRIIEEKVEE